MKHSVIAMIAMTFALFGGFDKLVSTVSADDAADSVRPAVELIGGEGYSRLVQRDVSVTKGTYAFSCLLSDDVRFSQFDHVP